MAERREGSTKRRDIARENLATPPSRERIDRLPLLGAGRLSLDFSGVSLEMQGLDEALLESAGRRFQAYRVDPGGAAGPLRVKIRVDETPYFVEPDREDAEGYYRMRIVHDGGLIRLVTYSMAAWLDISRLQSAVAFGAGDYDPRERALENFCRVATAWLAVERGGFFIHGASIIRGGRAYIFFGKSASGKSTLAKLDDEGRVVSDDLTLVLPGPGGLQVAGAPFRGTFGEGEPVTGRYPLAGMFRLVQDRITEVRVPRKVMGLAEFIANLPFVNDALQSYPGLMESLESRVRGVPILTLHFAKEPGFWKAVDRALENRSP